MRAEPDAGAQSHVHAGPGTKLNSRIAALPTAWAFWPAVAGAVTFVLAALILAWANSAKPMLKLEVSFSRDACCSWQVWVNGTTTADITVLPMQWGKTATYSVPLYTAHVDHLRMPIGQSASETMTMRKLWIAR